MKTIAGSILILAGAVLLQPAVESSNRFDEAIIFAGPVTILGVILMIVGLKSKS